MKKGRPLEPVQSRRNVCLRVYDQSLWTEAREVAESSKTSLSLVVEVALKDWLGRVKELFAKGTESL